jgi:hypothetical protein
MTQDWPFYFAQERTIRRLAIRAGLSRPRARALAAAVIAQPRLTTRVGALVALAARNSEIRKAFAALAARHTELRALRHSKPRRQHEHT